MQISLFDYIDYHSYMNVWFKSRQTGDSSFTYQTMANDLGMQSKSYLYSIFNSKKFLSLKSAKRIMPLFTFSAKEQEYFTLLVLLKKSKQGDERIELMEKIDGMLTPGTLKIERQKYTYLKDWYHPVIREIITSRKFNGDYGAIARSIIPAISTRQAKESVTLLQNLNLIQPSPNGYIVTDTVITAQDDTEVSAIRRHQKALINIASLGLDTFPSHQRQIFGFTAGVSESGYEKLQEIINRCKGEVVELLQNEKNIDKVCQLNVQLFPLTKDLTNKK